MKKITFPSVFIAALLLQVPAFAAQPAAQKASAAKKTPSSAARKTAVQQPASVKTESPAVAAATVTAAVPAVEKKTHPFADALGKMKSEDVSVRRQGAVYLAQSRDPRAAEPLNAALADESGPVRKAAVEGLGLLNYREAAVKIAGLLAADKENAVRQQAAISLSFLMVQETGPALVKALEDPVPSVRYAAMRTLGALKYMPAEEPIIKILSSAGGNAARSAISALGMLQSKKAVPAILSALGGKDQYVRLEAARALGETGDISAAAGLKSCLAATEPAGLRAEAALALSRLGLKDGISTARELISSGDMSIKGQALNALVEVHDFDSLPLIQELIAAETDPAGKSALEFAAQRLNDAKAMQPGK